MTLTTLPPDGDLIHPTDHRTPTLLVVDDEPSFGEIAQLWFGAHGWRVRVALSGPDGVTSVATRRPDLVVLDLMLPGYSGLEVLHRIHAMYPRLPVVVSTASDDTDLWRAALAGGATDVLLKPMSLMDLERHLAGVLLYQGWLRASH